MPWKEMEMTVVVDVDVGETKDEDVSAYPTVE
jgi:hypothetical protein